MASVHMILPVKIIEFVAPEIVQVDVESALAGEIRVKKKALKSVAKITKEVKIFFVLRKDLLLFNMKIFCIFQSLLIIKAVYSFLHYLKTKDSQVLTLFYTLSKSYI